MIVAHKTHITGAPVQILKANADCVVLLQTPQGALYIGGPGVTVDEGFLMNSTTTGILLTLVKDDELWGVTLPNEQALARVLIMTK
jgi:hypothetical protein